MKIKLFFTCLILLSSGLCFDAVSQELNSNPFPGEAVRIDPISRRPDKAIPFDRPFPIIIAVEDIGDITNVFAYKVIYHKLNSDYDKPGVSRLIKGKEKSDNELKKDSIEVKIDSVNKIDFPRLVKGKKIREIEFKKDSAFPIQGVKFRKDLKQKLLIIEFPALPPNTHFDFAIIRKPAGAILKEIRKYTDAIADSLVWGNPFPKLRLDTDFHILQDTIDRKAYPNSPKRFLVNKIFNDAPNANTTSLFDSVYLASHLDKDYRALKAFTFNTPLPDTAQIQAVSELFLAQQIKTSDMALLHKMVLNVDSLYFTGQLNIRGLSTEKIKTLNLSQRISNLDTCIVILKRLSADLINLSLLRTIATERVTIKDFSDKIDGLLIKLNQNRKKLSDINNSINDKIRNNKQVQYSEWYISTTEVRDFTTKSGYIFSPQIGLSMLLARSNDNSLDWIPKLNYGININLRAIDKLISRRYIVRPTVWHYLSLHVGLTMGGFRDKQYDNLYNNASLLIGPSVRITRALYFSTGVSLYRQKDNNPLINKFNVASGGYASILLDLDITNAISTIRNSIFK